MRTIRLSLLLALLTVAAASARADRIITLGDEDYIESDGDLSGLQQAVFEFLPKNIDNRSKLAAFSNRLLVNNDLGDALQLYFLGGNAGDYLTYTVTCGNDVETVTVQDNFTADDAVSAPLRGMLLKYPNENDTMSEGFSAGTTIDFFLTKEGQLMDDAPSHHVVVFTIDEPAYNDLVFIGCDDDGNWDYRDRVFVVYPSINVSPSTTISLSDHADNLATLTAYNNQTCNVTLSGRTLYRDGTWNTLCLPFDLTASQLNANGSPLKGTTIMTLAGSRFDPGTGTLTIDFNAATAITAGLPYIVRWDEASNLSNLTNPIFLGVTITKSSGEAISTQEVYFKGCLSPEPLTADDRSVLFLGGNNTLFYPDAAMNVNACRAYFQLLSGLTAGDLPVSHIKLFFGDESPTLVALPTGREAAGAWYDLQGRKMSHLPRGIYIVNGKKISIK